MQIILKNDMTKNMQYYIDNGYSTIGARLVSMLDYKEIRCVIAYKENFVSIRGRHECVFDLGSGLGDNYILYFEDGNYDSDIDVFECINIIKD